ncbi:MAG TPA: 3-deoxy-manno-octulosonate cytidylyltransferase [Gemmatimonadota bacterium]|nr:3-deoxy-manno-octulosonate cytidylyltransferase [Gemmatimonadota bacterium]
MILAAIPVRWGARRFPGKPLAPLRGRPVVAWVVEAALAAERVDRVAVVTDHPEIGRAAEAAGARAVVLDRPAESGSDRIAHLLEADPEAAGATVVVNVQGDEPLLESAAIDAAIHAVETSDADVTTLVRPLRPGEDPADPDLVKVAVADDGRAFWFSRAPIPHGDPTRIHVGLYAYRRAAFDAFVAAPPTRLERTERLEQLRILELGRTIRCVEFATRSIGIDTPADLERADAALDARKPPALH